MQICPCAFEVSRRIVLATRDIAIGHQALAKFTGVMNMRPPMNENSYRDHVALVRRAAKANCKQSKTNAVEEVKTVYEPKEEVKFDIEVSGDDTRRKEDIHPHMRLTLRSCLRNARNYLLYGVVPKNSRPGGRDTSITARSLGSSE